MEFAFTPEQEQFRLEVRAFCREQVGPEVRTRLERQRERQGDEQEREPLHRRDRADLPRTDE